MDQLETLVIPTETVKFGENSLTVTGLGLAHITYIVRHHQAVMSELYGQAVEGKLGTSIEEIVVKMIDDFAPVVAMALACAMGAPKQVEKAGKLPLGVQIDALDKIIRLTVVGEGGPEKLMEIVVRAMQGAASLTSPKT